MILLAGGAKPHPSERNFWYNK